MGTPRYPIRRLLLLTLLFLGAEAAHSPARAQSSDWRRRLIAPSAITRPDAPPLVLHGGRFDGTERFYIENIPAGVTVHRVGLGPPTWEFRDADGRRLALLQEEQWRHVLHGDLKPETAPPSAEAAGKTVRLEDWGGASARVRCEMMFTLLRLYRIERRAKGTDFVILGFRYDPPAYEPSGP